MVVPITAFSVEFQGESLFTFEAGVFRYESEVENAVTGDKLTVRAAADEGVELEILVDAMSKASGAGEVETADVDAPVSGETAAVGIEVRARKGSAMTSYTAEISPKQTEDFNDSTLQSLEVSYNSAAANRLNPAFTKEGNSYSMTSENGQTLGYVKAVASSSRAKIEIWYGDDNLTPSGTSSNMERTFALPARNADKDLVVKVQAESLLSIKLYTVKVFGYQDQNITYNGTVTCTLSGYTIKGVTAISGAAGTQGAQVQFDSPVANGFPWSLSAVETWVPRAFTVTLEKTVSGQKKAIESVAFTPASLSGQIALNITAPSQVGYRIFDANDFYYYLNTADYRTENFALAANIDLADYRDPDTLQPVDWNGPSNFQGRLYGNGYTVKNLVLSKNTSGTNSTALFSTLKDGAVLQDFNIEVSIAESAKVRAGNTYFGSVVGSIYLANNTDSVTLSGIKTKGTLDFTSEATGFILVGGFIAEIGDRGTINIENCASELNASLNLYSFNQATRLAGFGGFIGRIVGAVNQTLTVNITNSYATGNMSVRGDITNALLFCGGFIGDVLSRVTDPTINLIMTNCYSAGNISVTNISTSPLTVNGGLGAGGLIGSAWKTSGILNLTIQNCAVVGTEVFLNYNNVGSGFAVNNRFIAVPASSAPTSLTITNGIARKGMLLGAPPGTPDNSAGDLDNGGDLTKTSGLAKTAADLKTKAAWTSAGWNESVWDLSGLAQGKWPTLK